MLSKKIIVPMSAILITASTLMVTPFAYAQGSNSSAHPNFFEGLIQFISQKFSLDKTQVQAALKDYSVQNKQNMQQREQKRLDGLVSAGKITADQEKAILAELSTLRSKYNFADLKNLTADQRKQKMQDMQNELKTWAASQNIDPTLVIQGFGGFGMGKMMRGGKGEWK